MKKYENLAKIAELRDRGVLTEEEFQREKAKILEAEEKSLKQIFQAPEGGLLFGLQEDAYCTLLHLSQFCIPALPPFGVAVPIVLWFLGRGNSAKVDQCGRIIFNWLISALIYFGVSAALCYIVIGFALLPILVICAIAFPIIAAVKASEGMLWHYPLSIDFFDAGTVYSQKTQTARGESAPKNTGENSAQESKDLHFKSNKYESTSFSDKYR